MIQPRWIADGLFLTAQVGIYIIMGRDKKNTLITAEAPSAKRGPTRDAMVSRSVATVPVDASLQNMSIEINGPQGPEPTRYWDWEQKGRCTDV
jgi:hypothetical protein